MGSAPSTGTVAEWCKRYEIDPDRIVGWKVWYANGMLFSSSHYQADDLPDSGVQVVKVYYTRPESGEWRFSVRFTGNDPYWLPGATRPKEGTWVSDEEHQAFLDLTGPVGWP